jgi:hypothetical protein
MPPMDHEVLQATLSLVYATWGLVGTGLLAIIFTWWQLHNVRKQSRLDNLERVLEWFDSDRFVKLRKSLATKRLTSSGTLRGLDLNNPPGEAYDLLDFFEHIGFLVKKGHLNEYDVWHTFVAWIAAIHSDFKELTAIEQADDKTAYCDFCWLFRRVERVDLKQGGSGVLFDDLDLEGHYEYEKNLGVYRIAGPRRHRKLKRKIAEGSIPPDNL